MDVLFWILSEVMFVIKLDESIFGLFFLFWYFISFFVFFFNDFPELMFFDLLIDLMDEAGV